MILIGQYDSPFVRRVGIALRLYGLPYEHRPWSTFSDADEVGRFNPLRRVPTLVLDGGETLIESAAILDYLDEQVGRARALFPAGGAERRRALHVTALAMGLAEKGVGLFYERIFHPDPSEAWIRRCEGQIRDVLGALEEGRAGRATPFWFGQDIGHADIAVACALRLVREAHPALFDPERTPNLVAHADRCEGLEAFKAVVQPLSPPRG